MEEDSISESLTLLFDKPAPEMQNEISSEESNLNDEKLIKETIQKQDDKVDSNMGKYWCRAGKNRVKKLRTIRIKLSSILGKLKPA